MTSVRDTSDPDRGGPAYRDEPPSAVVSQGKRKPLARQRGASSFLRAPVAPNQSQVLISRTDQAWCGTVRAPSRGPSGNPGRHPRRVRDCSSPPACDLRRPRLGADLRRRDGRHPQDLRHLLCGLRRHQRGRGRPSTRRHDPGRAGRHDPGPGNQRRVHLDHAPHRGHHRGHGLRLDRRSLRQ